MGRLATSPSLLDQALTHEVLVQHLAGGHRPVGVQRLEVADDLTSTPTRSGPTELEGRLEHVGWYRIGSRIVTTAAAMSIFARSTRLPPSNSPARMRAKRSRFSSTLRSRNGLFLPGSVSEPWFARICSTLWSSTKALPCSIRSTANA
jgi:hypothetical protein